jgi:GTP cyclohydrolase I
MQWLYCVALRLPCVSLRSQGARQTKPRRSFTITAMEPNIEKMEALIRQLLVELGEDPDREGLVKTPERVAKAFSFLTHGYRQDLKTVINNALFTQTTSSMVIVKDIELYSLCEHHMLPFFGRCHIGYIPDGKVFGVSKLARMVDMYARRLQLQERLTEQISQVVMEECGAKGVGVMIEARHLCMMMRGVEKQNSTMVTSSVLGVFRDHLATREEFLSLVGKR